MIKSGNATVMVSDMGKAVEFYTQALGLKLKYEASAEWAEVTLDELCIGLHLKSEHAPKPGTNGAVSIGFMVDGLEKSMDELKHKGIKFSPHISEDGPVRLAFFADPDGNAMYLCEVKSMKEAEAAHGAAHGHIS
jgi:catechol 2,3-dioxygenase-like lactoylglutathione lyase family enzyme